MAGEEYQSAYTGKEIDERLGKVPGLEASVSHLSAEKVDKTSLTLGLHADGKYYIFVDGAPVGTGFELSGGASGDLFGYVDENNNVVLNGNLPDGTYTIKYEMTDGSVIEIGDLVLDSNTYYSVTNNLTNCTSSNSDTQAIGGQIHSTAITANDGYELSSVVVTMGGVDVSATAVSGGNISIAEVTGDIVITAVAEEAQSKFEPVTVDIALTDGIRIGSDGTDRTKAGHCATEMIDLTNIPKPCTINLTKAKWCSDGTSSTIRYHVADANEKALDNGPTAVATTDYMTVYDNSGIFNDVTVTITSDDVGYVRFSGWWANLQFSDSDTDFNLAGTKATMTYIPKA